MIFRVEKLIPPLVLRMMRKGLGLASSFPKGVLTGGRRFRMVGLDDWWDRSMREKALILMRVLVDDRWGNLREVVLLWLRRMGEAAGCREGVLSGEASVVEEHRDTWLGQVVMWMREVGIEVWERTGWKG